MKCNIGKKTLLEKEKLLVTSNFSFPHNIFHNYIFEVDQNAAFCGNGLKKNSILRSTFHLQFVCKFFNLDQPDFSCFGKEVIIKNSHQ